MKLAAVSLVLAALLDGASAKKYYNHQIAKDTTGILGPRAHHTYECPDEDEPKDEADSSSRDNSGLRARRRTEGEAPDPEMFDSSDIPGAGVVEDSEDTSFGGGGTDDAGFDDDDFESLHYQAASMDFIKKGIDPDFFEWVNPDEIAPGATTCGFLKPALGSLGDVNYPTIEVYVCMRFANTQPAAKGNLFLHCGGPGSLSNCILFFDEDLGEQNLNDYNLLSIDQRGMGRSWPSFLHEECSQYEVVRAENGTIIDAIPPPELENQTSADLGTAEDIKRSLAPWRRKVESCWTCEDCDFVLEAEQIDGNVTSFHFLEYSGTRQLAEDILRMTLLLDAPTMHVYGVSYGTAVFSTFATLFPSSTGLFILDSCISPNPDHYHNARTGAIGANARIDYIIYSCSASGACPVEDMRKCLGDISASLEGEGIGQGGLQTQLIQLVIQTMFRFADRAADICNAAGEGDTEGLFATLVELEPDIYGDESEARKRQEGSDPRSMPTFAEAVYGNPDYFILDQITQNTLVSVRAQDRSGPIYDEDRFAKEALEIAERYTGAGTGEPGQRFYSEYQIGYFWPSSVPVPPAGNSFITGIIIGVLYDSNTPYVWTQEMKSSFKNTHLITNQGIFHGIGGNDPSCQRHVQDYLKDGFPNFVDGQICGADFASVSDFGSIFGLAR